LKYKIETYGTLKAKKKKKSLFYPSGGTVHL